MIAGRSGQGGGGEKGEWRRDAAEGIAPDCGLAVAQGRLINSIPETTDKYRLFVSGDSGFQGKYGEILLFLRRLSGTRRFGGWILPEIY